MIKNKSNIKFYYNGIKVDGGKLIKCHYSKGNLTNHPETTITIYASDYGHVLPTTLNPQNDTDIMTDYFDKDRARVAIEHPLYKEIHEAYMKQQARYMKQRDVREAKFIERWGK